MPPILPTDTHCACYLYCSGIFVCLYAVRRAMLCLDIVWLCSSQRSFTRLIVICSSTVSGWSLAACRRCEWYCVYLFNYYIMIIGEWLWRISDWAVISEPLCACVWSSLSPASVTGVVKCLFLMSAAAPFGVVLFFSRRTNNLDFTPRWFVGYSCWRWIFSA